MPYDSYWRVLPLNRRRPARSYCCYTAYRADVHGQQVLPDVPDRERVARLATLRQLHDHGRHVHGGTRRRRVRSAVPHRLGPGRGVTYVLSPPSRPRTSAVPPRCICRSFGRVHVKSARGCHVPLCVMWPSWHVSVSVICPCVSCAVCVLCRCVCLVPVCVMCRCVSCAGVCSLPLSVMWPCVICPVAVCVMWPCL